MLDLTGSNSRLWWNSWQKFKTLLSQPRHKETVAEDAHCSKSRITGGRCARIHGWDYGNCRLSSQTRTYFTLCPTTDCHTLSSSTSTTGIASCWSIHEDKERCKTKVNNWVSPRFDWLVQRSNLNFFHTNKLL